MSTQTESKASETAIKSENPMQERYCGEVSESVELTAEAAFMARKLEARAAVSHRRAAARGTTPQACGANGEQGRSIREEAGPVFVP